MYLCVFVIWGSDVADISVHVLILFTHTVVSSICNPVNDSYHLILSSQPMMSGELNFKNTKINCEKGNT